MSDLTNYFKEVQKTSNSKFGAEILSAIEESESEKEVNEYEGLRDKFQKYKIAENGDNLLRIPYETWNQLPHKSQEKIKNLLDPLRWNAIFVPYSDFLRNAKNVFQFLGDKEEYVIISEYKCFVLQKHRIVGNSDILSGSVGRSREKKLLSKKPLIIFKMKNGVLNVEKKQEKKDDCKS